MLEIVGDNMKTVFRSQKTQIALLASEFNCFAWTARHLPAEK